MNEISKFNYSLYVPIYTITTFKYLLRIYRTFKYLFIIPIISTRLKVDIIIISGYVTRLFSNGVLDEQLYSELNKLDPSVGVLLLHVPYLLAKRDV